MPYKADLLFNGSSPSHEAGNPTRELGAKTDAAAIAEAERLLRSSRVVAGVEGTKPPSAGVISKDGKEFVCCIVNRPTDEASSAFVDKLQSTS